MAIMITGVILSEIFHSPLMNCKGVRRIKIIKPESSWNVLLSLHEDDLLELSAPIKKV